MLFVNRKTEIPSLTEHTKIREREIIHILRKSYGSKVLFVTVLVCFSSFMVEEEIS